MLKNIFKMIQIFSLLDNVFETALTNCTESEQVFLVET